jgi:hypothetical protein
MCLPKRCITLAYVQKRRPKQKGNVADKKEHGRSLSTGAPLRENRLFVILTNIAFLGTTPAGVTQAVQSRSPTKG